MQPPAAAQRLATAQLRLVAAELDAITTELEPLRAGMAVLLGALAVVVGVGLVLAAVKRLAEVVVPDLEPTTTPLQLGGPLVVGLEQLIQ